MVFLEELIDRYWINSRKSSHAGQFILSSQAKNDSVDFVYKVSLEHMNMNEKSLNVIINYEMTSTQNVLAFID